MSGAFMWQLQHHFCFTISWSQFKTALHLTHEVVWLYVTGTGIWQEQFLIYNLLSSVSMFYTWCRVTLVLKPVRLIWRSDSSRAIRVAGSCLLWEALKCWALEEERNYKTMAGKTSALPDKICDIHLREAVLVLSGQFLYLLPFHGDFLSLLLHPAHMPGAKLASGSSKRSQLAVWEPPHQWILLM